MPHAGLPMGLAAGAVILALAVALVLLARDRLRVRRAAMTQWQAYLDCVEQSLQNLSAMQSMLQSLASDAPDAADDINGSIRQTVATEIEALRNQLDRFVSLSDFLFPDAPIVWRPFPPLAGVLRSLVEQAVQRFSQTAEGRSSVEQRWLELDGAMGDLHTHGDGLERKIAELVEGLSALTGLADAQQDDLPQPAERKAPNEESVAAHLVGTLGTNLSFEEIDTRLAETDKELDRLRVEAPAATDPATKEKLEGHMEWLLQVKRWWRIQQRLRHQENLLMESQGELEKIADTDYRDRFRLWLQSSSLRDENMTLQSRLTALATEKHELEARIQTAQQHQPPVEKLLGTVAHMQGIQASHTGTVEALARSLQGLRGAIQTLGIADQPEPTAEASQAELLRKLAGQHKRILSLTDELDNARLNFEKERLQYHQSLTIMGNALEMATVDKKTLEEGLRQLQDSYTALKQRLERRDSRSAPAGE